MYDWWLMLGSSSFVGVYSFVRYDAVLGNNHLEKCHAQRETAKVRKSYVEDVRIEECRGITCHFKVEHSENRTIVAVHLIQVYFGLAQS